MYDSLVFIGRCQPFHHGHLRVLQQALAQAKHVVVLLGSAQQPRTVRNPFLCSERESMLRACLSAADNARVQVLPLRDSLYDDARWTADVRAAVNSLYPSSARIGLIGHLKDSSSYYLQLFPGWDMVAVDNFQSLSATPLRERFLLSGILDVDNLPEPVQHWLGDFAQTPAYAEIQAEAQFLQGYKAAWASAPYPPVFVTVDAVVVQAGHVLVVERGQRPGKGLLALPGGFLDQQETLLSACLRELQEETALAVDAHILQAALVTQRTFDDPYRSERGRTITAAFHFRLPGERAPAVQAGDDASAAFWLPLDQVTPERFFDDHYHMIRVMVGLP